ncbi:protocadherin alpha-C2-like isoform X2 [Clavelina lepadiformis]|uniref:protocadherin alpha-C2-like isoform X2 n=1 Tax=Clavelina lepadiformis TaxID=159417 RepID=UPI0040436D9A
MLVSGKSSNSGITVEDLPVDGATIKEEFPSLTFRERQELKQFLSDVLKKEYSVMTPEDTKPGEQIIRVQAHDIDAGLAGTVRYYLSSLNKKTTFDLLNVNELTGEVSLASRLD